VSLGLATPCNLLLFTFLIGAAGALTTPAWQSIVPQLVPREDLRPAIAANGAGVNVSRAIGPALGGALVAKAGIGAPFWINAISNFGVIGALLWWRPSPRPARQLPGERFVSAIRTGVRHARYNLALRATMIRGAAFFLFASAYWALLPLLARDHISGGADVYGYLLGTIGAGAVAGTFALASVKDKFDANVLAAGATASTALAMMLFAVARNPATALVASLLAGVSWIAVLSSLTVSAQAALPDWVRGRGLAIYAMAFFGSLTLGSALWGKFAASTSLAAALFAAAAGAVVAIPLTWRWRLQSGTGIDLTPSPHWPEPIVATDIAEDRGPVLVTVEYRIDPADRAPFLAALHELARERRRDGAYAWRVFEDAAIEGRMLETFLSESWLEHLRQHQRVTNADRVVQEVVQRFHTKGTPLVSHLIACEFVAPAATKSDGGANRR
jgi:predicted MFS family arabinose efflux permease